MSIVVGSQGVSVGSWDEDRALSRRGGEVRRERSE